MAEIAFNGNAHHPHERVVSIIPPCNNQKKGLHGKWDGSVVDRMYADNNAETFECEHSLGMKRILDTVKLGNPSSPHTEGTAAKRILEWARRSLCAQVGITEKHTTEKGYGVVFTSGATESNRLGIIGGLERANRWKSIGSCSRKMKLVTTPLEHSSVVSIANYLADGDGDPLTNSELVAVDHDGYVVENKLLDLASDPEVGVVAIILAHNELGRVQNDASIGKAILGARRNREQYLLSHSSADSVQFPLLHYDAAQLLGRREVNFPSLLACDTMSWSAHKFHGPNGFGGLYVRTNDIIDPNPGCCQTSRSARGFKVGEYPDFTGHEMGLRSGTENVCGAACSAAALASARYNGLILGRWKETSERGERIARSAKIIFGSRIMVNCRPGHGNSLCNTVHLSFVDGTKGTSVVELLDKKFGVSVSTGSACLMSAPSKALKSINLSDTAIVGSIRISLSLYDPPGTVERMEESFIQLSKGFV